MDAETQGARRGLRIVPLVTAALVALLVAPGSTRAQETEPAAVTTAGYSNLRDDWDSHEPALEPADVRSGSFGKLFEAKLQGSIYSQPLVYENHVIVTTEKANAYAINATTGAIVWKRNFGKPFTSKAVHCSDLAPYLGSTSTPVIDPSTGTIYMTTRLLEGGRAVSNGVWYLQAISAATGQERAGFPVKISGTPYNTPGVPFNEHWAQQRPGLLLLDGVVYIGFASDCDFQPYRGIVVGVNASSGSITTMWADESGDGSGPDSMAGIWEGGAGLVSNEPGRIILTTGNGISPSPAPSGAPPTTLSESVVGMQVEASGEIAPTQFFAPSNAPELDNSDEDLGSGGPIALPTEFFGTKAIPHLVVQVGKDGRVFLINADNMGGYRQGAGGGDAVLQTLGPYSGVWGHPAAYGGQGGLVYVLESAGGGYLRAFSYGLTGSGLPALASAATSAESFGYTSGSAMVTSNGTSLGSPVVWVVYSSGPTGSGGELRAYSGTPQGGNLPLLWMGSIGTASKFATPTAHEGRVYVGNRQGDLFAFGNAASAPLQAKPLALGSVPVGSTRVFDLTLSAHARLTLTGRVTIRGHEQIPSTEASVAAATVKSSTAGPSFIPPSGVADLPNGVVTVRQPRIGSAIPAGRHLHLRVRFSPTHAGPVIGLITLRTSAGRRSFAFTGYATRPGLLVSARPLHFRPLRTGAGGSALALTFSNTWNRPERLTRIRLPGRPFYVSGLPRLGTVLAPRQSVTVSVSFRPRRHGHFHSRLTIGTNHGSVTLPATGEALTGHPRLSIAPVRLNFGDVPVGAAAVRTFTVGDSGDVPLEITRAIVPEEPFSAAIPLSAGITLERGVVARVTVTFQPTRKGPASGVYIIDSSDGHGYYRVWLSGEGT